MCKVLAAPRAAFGTVGMGKPSSSHKIPIPRFPEKFGVRLPAISRLFQLFELQDDPAKLQRLYPTFFSMPDSLAAVKRLLRDRPHSSDNSLMGASPWKNTPIPSSQAGTRLLPSFPKLFWSPAVSEGFSRSPLEFFCGFCRSLGKREKRTI